MNVSFGKPDWIDVLDGARKVFVLFSGGKDSSATLAYTKEVVDKWAPLAKVNAIFADTTIGLPDSEEFIQDFCALLHIPLHIVRPNRDYFTLVGKWGVPRPRARWCCYHLKIEPIKKFLQGYSDYVVIDGIRRKESRKRSLYPATYKHPHFGMVIHPIIDWTDEEVNEYLECKELPINPAYSFGFSSWECWCGVFKRKGEFEKLKEVEPDFFLKLVKLESEFKSGYAYAYFNGKPFYLRNLLSTEERKALGIDI